MTDPVIFHDVQTLAFAGGGNRCWWQAGALARLVEDGARLPATLIGTSAGAAVAASFLTEGPHAALDACLKLYASTERMFDWRALTRLRLRFAHQEIYPAWIESFVNHGTFDKLRNACSSLLVAVSRPARAMGLAGSIAAGTLAYLVDKKLWHSIHPRLPGFLGLRQEFISLRDCQSADDAQALLRAAAAAPPFMRSVRLTGDWAFDGGYTDNAPVPAQSAQQRSTSLVLLTRHYPDRPAMFRWQGRCYWQPTRAVPVSTWDCTFRATVMDAFELGQRDANQALANGSLAIR